MTKKYDDYRAHGALQGSCVLCEKVPLHKFVHWKIISNDFPYDLIAEVHEMIVPIRHSIEEGLTQEERDEFFEIKQGYLQKYGYIIEATRTVKSIPEHFHLHLIIEKAS